MLMGAAGPAILAGFLDGQRARERALEQQAREAQQLQLAIARDLAIVGGRIGSRMGNPPAPAHCLSCGASRTEYQRGRRRCAYCGSDR